MVFALFVLALALVPGLQSTTLTIQNVPAIITIPTGEAAVQTLPGAIVEEESVVEPELRPLPIPEVEAVEPELRPLPIPEIEVVEPELRPLPVPEVEVVNPCDSCFEYMTALIEQLTESTVVEEPAVPERPPSAVYPHPVPAVNALPSEYLRV